jgi:acetolactate synthase-1/2/3 large subunit
MKVLDGRGGNDVKGGSSKLSGGRFIAEVLAGYGVTHVFFVPAILRKGLVEMEALGIQRVMTHSEKAAAYMADGYARASRRPGVCFAQSVGAANLASGLQDPYLGLSPVIAITGRKPPVAQHRNAYQEILHHSMFDPVTKYNVYAEAVEQLPQLLRQAFREATSGAPRPVHLEVSGQLGQVTDDWEAELEVVVEERFKQYPSNRPEPDKERVREAVTMIQAAERPVIVSGGGAKASSADAEIIELAERLGIPVATSLAGKGIISEQHPLSIGVVGSYSRWCANRIVSEADLVIFIGSRTGDQVTFGWRIPKAGTRVIQIDIDPSELGRNYPNQVSLLGDAKVTVHRLAESIQTRSTKRDWALHAEGLVNQWRKELEPLWHSTKPPLRPERLCRVLTEVLPANGILVADTGHSGIWTGTMLDIVDPEQTYLRSAGSLGWAFPASLGAKCGAPDRPVICFTGDGGFYYHLSELETALRCGIHTVTIVNNNASYGQELKWVDASYGARSGDRDGLYKFRKVDFARLAETFGCLGIRVENSEALKPALEAALRADRPVVVDVVTEPDHKPQEAWLPA